jgi:hypothetical protein
MRQMFGALAGGRVFEGLTGGLILAVAVILLLLLVVPIILYQQAQARAQEG